MNPKQLLSLLVVAIATTSYSQNDLRVEELDISIISQTYGSPSKNRSVTGEPLKVAGSVFSNGIGVHSASVVKINLHGNSSTFKSKVGVVDSSVDLAAADITTIPLADGKRIFYKSNENNKQFVGVEGEAGKISAGSVVFRVVGDSKELYNSGIVRAGGKVKEIDVKVQGVQVLELIVDDAGDGNSGDVAAWLEPVLNYHEIKPGTVDVAFVGDVKVTESAYTKSILAKSSKLANCEIPLKKVGYDWLINRDKAKASVMSANNGKDIILTNGLVARIFRVSPTLATIDFANLMTGENMLRAVSNEGVLKIDGKNYPIGGFDGQFEYGYIQYKWIDNLIPAANSFTVKDFEITDLTPRIAWAKSRWSSNTKSPTGKVITFTMVHSSPLLSGVVVKLHYAVYDGIPTISKWMDVENNSTLPIVIDEFKLEQLAISEPESPVELGENDPRFLKPNIHIESDWAFRGFLAKEADVTEYWEADPRFTSQCNYPMVTPCLLEVKLPMGPNETVKSGETFTSFRVWEMPMDSWDRERKGLFIRQMYRTISPWLTENPIFMHCTSSDPEVVITAINQCAETGYEMVILSFGSGLDMENESEENYAKFKSLNDYARSKGVDLGGYSLLSSRWISDDVDVINPKTGKRGGMIFGSSPCLSSDWGYDYFRKIKKFYEKTGMRVFENDGSYPGNVCASETHVHHKGLLDSQWEQRNQIAGLYKWMCENGVYTNIPDFGYMHNGGTKVGIGYREVNWSLPRERQLVLGRQVNYDGMWDRIPSMCWTFVPLTQYHGGGAAATLEPLSEHLKEYEGHMMQNYGAGIQACYRGHRLYDTDKTKEVVKGVIDWYKKYRYILNSDILHLRRADGRDYDGFMHVNPSLKEKAVIMLFNPLDEAVVREIELPLYYTGLTQKAMIREKESSAQSYTLSRDFKATVKVTIPAGGYTWLVVE